MNRLYIYFTFLALFLVNPLQAQDDWKRDSVPPSKVIYTKADENPLFPGGSAGFSRFMRENYVCPREVYKVQTVKGKEPLRFVVRKDGVACGLQQGDMPDVLYKEWLRLFHLMPRWMPAKVNGRPVDMACEFYVHMSETSDSGLPYHLDPIWKDVRKEVEYGTVYKKGMERAEADSLIAKLSSIASYEPGHVGSSTALAGLLASEGQVYKSVLVAKACAESYHKDVENTLMDLKFDKSMAALFVGNGFDCRDDLRASLSYLSACEYAGDDTLVRKAYAFVSDVINLVMDFKYIDKKATWSNEEYRRLMREKIYIALHERNTSVNLDDADRKEIMEGRTLIGMTRVIDKEIAQGNISNARILQITKELKELEKRAIFRDSMGKDSLNLYGQRALTLYLSQGMDAQRQYMDSLSGQSKELKKYFSKMSENIRKHEAELSDRAAVIRSLACFAPINEEGDSKEEKKRRAKEFYKYRDAVAAVYPLEWLWK